MPILDDIADRDVVPILARQAALHATTNARGSTNSRCDDRAVDAGGRGLSRAAHVAPARDCVVGCARNCARDDVGDGTHPPSADEVERAIEVVRGNVVATELSGGRRLSRRDQHLTLE